MKFTRVFVTSGGAIYLADGVGIADDTHLPTWFACAPPGRGAWRALPGPNQVCTIFASDELGEALHVWCGMVLRGVGWTGVLTFVHVPFPFQFTRVFVCTCEEDPGSPRTCGDTSEIRSCEPIHLDDGWGIGTDPVRPEWFVCGPAPGRSWSSEPPATCTITATDPLGVRRAWHRMRLSAPSTTPTGGYAFVDEAAPRPLTGRWKLAPLPPEVILLGLSTAQVGEQIYGLLSAYIGGQLQNFQLAGTSRYPDVELSATPVLPGPLLLPFSFNGSFVVGGAVTGRLRGAFNGPAELLPLPTASTLPALTGFWTVSGLPAKDAVVELYLTDSNGSVSGTFVIDEARGAQHAQQSFNVLGTVVYPSVTLDAVARSGAVTRLFRGAFTLDGTVEGQLVDVTDGGLVRPATLAPAPDLPGGIKGLWDVIGLPERFAIIELFLEESGAYVTGTLVLATKSGTGGEWSVTGNEDLPEINLNFWSSAPIEPLEPAWFSFMGRSVSAAVIVGYLSGAFTGPASLVRKNLPA